MTALGMKQRIEYTEYPPKRIMAAELMLKLGLGHDKRMFHNDYGYNLLEDIKKSCLIALWEKICNEQQQNL